MKKKNNMAKESKDSIESTSKIEKTESTNSNSRIENSESVDSSSRVEKEELEKKYYSQKKEIREKLLEAKDALEVQVKEAEEDLEKVLKEEPELLTREDVAAYTTQLEEQKKQIKTDIIMLENHEQELELNYEDLKTEPKVHRLNDYSKAINHVISINSPLMKMVFDYFNFLDDKKDNQEKAKLKIDCFLNENGLFMENFPHNTTMDFYTGSVMINFKGIVRVIVTLKKYYDQQQGFIYKLCFVSEGKTELNPEYLSKKILFNAISHSKIKGTYFTLPVNSIMWQPENLERRGFSDIFLPKSIMQDLNLYTTLHDKTGKLLRYLMIGSPGTGKTESTLAIANYLKDKKVTIIKTMVCDALKEKIELAELLAPSLIIFDDIDLSLGSRKKGMVSSGLAQFLDVLDGTEKIRKDVGFIATTNSLELLDMAAQRPGRFDKLLSFDSLTKMNIKNIILKSLKRNFEMDDASEEIKPFVDQIVVEKFHSSRVTGAHVYNTIKMLYLRIQTLELTDINPEWIVSEVKSELDTLDRIRRTDYLKDKITGSSNGEIGFPVMRNDVIDDEEECEYEMEEKEVSAKSEFHFGIVEEAGEKSQPKRHHRDSSSETAKESPSESNFDSEQTESKF